MMLAASVLCSCWYVEKSHLSHATTGILMSFVAKLKLIFRLLAEYTGSLLLPGEMNISLLQFKPYNQCKKRLKKRWMDGWDWRLSRSLHLLRTPDGAAKELKLRSNLPKHPDMGSENVSSQIWKSASLQGSHCGTNGRHCSIYI